MHFLTKFSLIALTSLLCGNAHAATLSVVSNASGATCGTGAGLGQNQQVEGVGARISTAGTNIFGCGGQADASAGSGFLSVFSSAMMLPVDPNNPEVQNNPRKNINGRGIGYRASASDIARFSVERTDLSLDPNAIFLISASIDLTATSRATFSLYDDGAISFPGAGGAVLAGLRINLWADDQLGTNLSSDTTTVGSNVSPTNPAPGDSIENTHFETLTTLPTFVRAGDELALTTQLSSRSEVRGSRGTVGLAIGDSSNTLAFATDRPVFDLPDGYTVNIPEWNIFDNYWTDPRDNGSQDSDQDTGTSVVPIPASAWLLLASFGALFGLRRKPTG